MRAKLVLFCLAIDLSHCQDETRGAFDANYDFDGDDNEDEEKREREIEKLKREIFALSPEAARRRFGEIKPRGRPPPRQQKVDHFVVLYMENHAADQIFGCMNLPGFDGIPASGHHVPRVPGLPALGFVNISCGTADYVCKHGPTYDKFSSKFRSIDELAATRYPYGGKEAQDDKYSFIHGLEAGSSSTAARLFSPEQIPIKACTLHPAPCNMQHATCNMQHAMATCARACACTCSACPMYVSSCIWLARGQ